MYTIEVDAAKGLIKTKLIGFWNRSVFESYRRDILTLSRNLAENAGGHVTLCDITEAMIQPQDIIAAFQDFIVNAPLKSRKIALHTSSLLSRMQGKRLAAVHPSLRVFTTREEALNWLFDPAERRASA